jgi:hypothetical protein
VADDFVNVTTSLEPFRVPATVPFGIDPDDDGYYWLVHPVLDRDSGGSTVVVGLVVSIISEPATATPSVPPPTAELTSYSTKWSTW